MFNVVSQVVLCDRGMFCNVALWRCFKVWFHFGVLGPETLVNIMK